MPTPPKCRRLKIQIGLIKKKFKNGAESAVTPSAPFFSYSENVSRFVAGMGSKIFK